MCTLVESIADCKNMCTCRSYSLRFGRNLWKKGAFVLLFIIIYLFFCRPQVFELSKTFFYSFINTAIYPEKCQEGIIQIHVLYLPDIPDAQA